MFDIAFWLKKLKLPLIMLAILSAVFVMLAAFLTGDTIRRGVRIENTDVSGLSAVEARRLLMESVNERYSGGSFSLIRGTREWRFGLDRISYRFLADEAVNKAFSVGRTGGFFSRTFRAVSLLADNLTLEIGTEYDRDKLTGILNNIKSEIDTKETNAAVSYKSGKIMLAQDSGGLRLDIDRSLKLVENHLRERDFDRIELAADTVKPSVQYASIKDINTVLSLFSTTFNPSDANRSDNIRLACSRLDGRILMPGEEFSMNEALGPRTIENGYKEAPVIYKNELIKGPGGGICQVTTTLYDAVLLSRLKVLERSHHSMPLGYVRPGQDATIAEDSIDFRFVNSFDYPVSLAAEVIKDKIYIRILGRGGPEAYVVKLVSEIIAEYPPGEDEIEVDNSLADGQRVVAREGRTGLRAVLYRDTYSADGVLLGREKISEDYYKPSKGLIKVNSNYYVQYLLFTKEFQNE